MYESLAIALIYLVIELAVYYAGRKNKPQRKATKDEQYETAIATGDETTFAFHDRELNERVQQLLSKWRRKRGEKGYRGSERGDM